jgi:hypothetical protein
MAAWRKSCLSPRGRAGLDGRIEARTRSYVERIPLRPGVRDRGVDSRLMARWTRRRDSRFGRATGDEGGRRYGPPPNCPAVTASLYLVNGPVAHQWTTPVLIPVFRNRTKLGFTGLLP